MLRATQIVRAPAVNPERVVDVVRLDHEARHRRRVSLKGEGGTAFLLDLDRASVLRGGDALRLEDGRLVRVEAAPERLIEVRTDNPLRLLRLAWHVGNRHTPAELSDEALYIQADRVLEEMVRGLGATTRIVERPFEPERGAYDGHAHGGHAHGGHAHGGHSHGEPAAERRHG